MMKSSLFIVFYFFYILTNVYGQQHLPEDDEYIYEVLREEIDLSQNGFKLKDIDGVFTSLHGILMNVSGPNDLINLEVEIFSIKKNKNASSSYNAILESISIEDDLAYFRFKKGGPKVSAGFGYQKYQNNEVESKCLNDPDCISRFGFAMKDGIRHSNNIKGKIQNCHRTIESLINGNTLDQQAWDDYKLLLSTIFYKQNAFDFTVNGRIEKGMSGSPIFLQSKAMIFGMVALDATENIGIGFHFDTTGLELISSFLTRNTQSYKTLQEAIDAHREWATTRFCNLELCCSGPSESYLNSRYYNCPDGSESLSKKTKKKLKHRNFRKMLPIAYRQHFDLDTSKNGKTLPFLLLLENKSNKNYNENLKGHTLSDVFLKALYAKHSKGEGLYKYNLDSMVVKLSNHYDHTPITAGIGKKIKKGLRHQNKDQKFWRKNGYDLDHEIKKFIRSHYGESACDSSFQELLKAVRDSDFCYVHLLGKDILGRYCESVQDKRDSIGKILCKNLNTVTFIADSLIKCAEASLSEGRLTCAYNALNAASRLLECVDQYTDIDSIQLAINYIDSMINAKALSRDQFSAQSVYNALNYSFDQFRKEIRSPFIPMPANMELGSAPTVFLDTISFDYYYGNVDPSEYYLSVFHSGFPPAVYKNRASDMALQQLIELLRSFIEDPLLSIIFPVESVKIEIEGFADGLPYLGDFKYAGEWGDSINDHFVQFAAPDFIGNNQVPFVGGKFKDLRENRARNKAGDIRDIGHGKGRGKNYALSYLRAMHAYDKLTKANLGLKEANFIKTANVVDFTDAEGSFRKMQIKLTLIPNLKMLQEPFESEGSCSCSEWINRYGALFYD